jgi:hypothetical protein
MYNYKIMKDHWIMDYETLTNCFVGVFQHYKNENRRIFIVHKLKNDFPQLVDFLIKCSKEGQWHISYNGLAFDSQLTQYIMLAKDELLSKDPDAICESLYAKAQRIIENQDAREFSEYPEKDLLVKQIDLFKLNHWDNPAKRSSLKWIQFSMDWHNLLDMPIHHTTYVETHEQIRTIVEYCINDVKSTREIYYKSQDQIALRQALTKEYGINLYSASEPRISKELFLHFLSKKLPMKKYDIKQLRTKRSEIVVDDILLDYIKFERIEFKQLLANFRKKVLDPINTKGGFKYSVRYKGVTTDFGLGGLHGCTTPGVYEAKDGMIIMTSDVTSFYPNLAIRNRWSPAHLPKDEFCELYEWFFEERKKIPKKDPRNYVYKIILNSTYGLSNDQNSFLYDPEFTMRITINGQLSLAMLYEMICEAIPEAIPLMQNTDGLETMIPSNKKGLYLEICRKWEELTKLQLEHDQYQKIVLADVNNYIAVYDWKEVTVDEYEKVLGKTPSTYHSKEEDGKYYLAATKCKGRFEFTELALHKNKSFLIIPMAVFNYFVKGIKPQDTLVLNRNIVDYCAGVKGKGDWSFFETCVTDGEITVKKLQQTLRYYISEKGCKILKINEVDGREIQVESGKWLQTIFVRMDKKAWKDYGIDESYYLQAIDREISNIERNTNQLALF